MWVVRNNEGELELWKNKPYRDGGYWTSSNFYPLCEIYDDKFSDLTFDDEPVEVELAIKKRMNFNLSDETIKLIEKDTGSSIDELRNKNL